MPTARLVLVSVALLSGTARSAGADELNPSDSGVQTLVTVHRFLHDVPTADPDQAALRYGWVGGRWRAMLGSGVVLVGGGGDGIRASLALVAFVELQNLGTDQPVPWESFRANIGFDTSWESRRLERALLPAGGRIHATLGFFHESDHPANVLRYEADYLRPHVPFFDYANFSAYEYVKLRATYVQPLWGGRLTAQSALGTRLFPPPLNPGSVREMRASVLAESRLTARAGEVVHPFVASYFELVDNGFVGRAHEFLSSADADPLLYAIALVGVDVQGSSGAVLSQYLSISSAHGRGVDFPKYFAHELGFGVTLLL